MATQTWLEWIQRWSKSRGVRGGAVAIVAGVLGLSTADVEQTAQLLTHVASIIGGARAIYGRINHRDIA